MKAIETTYDGHRFRSRLEARWAVFFNALNIPYEYEPQGFLVYSGPGRTQEKVAYLPDFYLPSIGIWAEVKGRIIWGTPEYNLLIGASYDNDGLPRNPEGDTLNDDVATRGLGNPHGNRNGPRILILGDIPKDAEKVYNDESGRFWHHMLTHNKGSIFIEHFSFAIRYGNNDKCDIDRTSNWKLSWSDLLGFEIANDSGDMFETQCQLVDHHTSLPGRLPGSVAVAYVKARMARFEHGEKP